MCERFAGAARRWRTILYGKELGAKIKANAGHGRCDLRERGRGRSAVHPFQQTEDLLLPYANGGDSAPLQRRVRCYSQTRDRRLIPGAWCNAGRLPRRALFYKKSVFRPGAGSGVRHSFGRVTDGIATDEGCHFSLPFQAPSAELVPDCGDRAIAEIYFQQVLGR